jgi:hypothetical protein
MVIAYLKMPSLQSPRETEEWLDATRMAGNAVEIRTWALAIQILELYQYQPVWFVNLGFVACFLSCRI